MTAPAPRPWSQGLWEHLYGATLGWGEEPRDGWEVLPGRKAAGKMQVGVTTRSTNGPRDSTAEAGRPRAMTIPEFTHSPFFSRCVHDNAAPFLQTDASYRVPAAQLHSSHKVIQSQDLASGWGNIVHAGHMAVPSLSCVPKTGEDATGRQQSQTSKPVITEEKGQI